MRAASTGGGLVRFVVICLVVLAALVMTVAGASSTSAAAVSATVTATATATAAQKNTAAAAPTTAMSAAAAASDAPADPVNATTTGNATCELVGVWLRKPECPGQISEGPGPPCAPCAARSDNNNNTNTNTYNNNNNKYNINNTNNNNNIKNNINNNRNINYNDNKNNNNNNNSNHQCLEYARRELIPTMCPEDPSAYRHPGRLSRYRLRHCCHHTVESAVQRPYSDRESCEREVKEAIYMDEIAAAMSCQFNEVLARYDCTQQYSAKSCDSCKDAYALWACAAILPYWSTTEQGHRYRVNACRSVCLETEQKCPWLLPVADDTNPYAGEATFTCIDPDIGYEMSLADLKEDCCYEHCADGLCVRNESLCNGGTSGNDGMDQSIPVCVVNVNLDKDVSECPDYSAIDSSGGERRAQPAAPARLLLVLLLALAFTRAALMAAVT